MIIPAGNLRIYIATDPIDFRKGMDGLAGHINATFDLDPYSGAIFVFRSRQANKLKMLVWDGTGMVRIRRLRPIDFRVAQGCAWAACVI